MSTFTKENDKYYCSDKIEFDKDAKIAEIDARITKIQGVIDGLNDEKTAIEAL